MRRALIMLAILAFGASCAGAEPAPGAQPGPMAEPAVTPVYQLVVTNPGTRSQGVRGVLFGPDGKPAPSADDPFGEAPAPLPVETPLGHFEWVRCASLWSVCGWQRIQPGETRAPIDNQPSVSGLTEYHIDKVPGANAPVWRGEIFDHGKRVEPAGDRIETPIGVLVRYDGKLLGQQWRGWIPAAWLAREHLYYEMSIWGAGSKSQHMTGAFFDERGQEIHMLSLEVVNTPIGPFTSVAGGYLWEDTGMFHQGWAERFVPPVAGAEKVNVSAFRVIQIGDAKAPSFRGELIESEISLHPAGERVDTDLGPMMRIDGAYNGHPWSGWIPVGWVPPKSP